MSGYIMDLRRLVGHRALLQVGASVLVEDAQGRLLLQRRSDNGCWGYPGGSVELDEEVEAAAARELYEETGIRAKSLSLFGVYSGAALHYVYPNGDEVSNVDVVFLCRDWDGALRVQAGEVEELRFVAAEDLPTDLMPPNRPVLADWLRRRGKSGQ